MRHHGCVASLCVASFVSFVFSFNFFAVSFAFSIARISSGFGGGFSASFL